MDYLQTPTGDPRLDQHLDSVRRVEWRETPLGDISGWPTEMAVFLAAIMVRLHKVGQVKKCSLISFV